jgi:hypothetical protein
MDTNTPIAFAFETVAVPSASGTIGLSRQKFDTGGLPVRQALITVNAGPIVSYTIDGTVVTPTVGHKVTAFGTVLLEGWDNIKRFSATSVSTGTAASISVSYLR